MPALANVNYQQQSENVEINVGDTLANLADKVLGNQANWREIAEANGLNIFEDLPIAQTITIPTGTELEAWVLGQSRNAVNDIKATITDNSLFQDVDNLSGGELTKFLNNQIDGGFKKLSGLGIGALGDSLNAQVKLIDWLY